MAIQLYDSASPRNRATAGTAPKVGLIASEMKGAAPKVPKKTIKKAKKMPKKGSKKCK